MTIHIRRAAAAALAAVLLAAPALAQQPPSAVTLTINPDPPCLDTRPNGYLNFDLVIRNGTAREVKVRELRAKVLGPKDELLEQRIAWQDAVSILGPHRTVAAGAEGLLYNPFHFNTAGQPGARIRYELTFESGPPAEVTVRPRACVTRARLISPVAGRVLIHDGFDFLSHHRRQAFQIEPQFKAFGLVDNWYRFALDFIPIDEKGAMFRGEGGAYEDWYGWGMPVQAAGDGVVTHVRDTIPDNALGSEARDAKRLSQDEMDSDGNYVLVDHGTGEVSAYSHLRRGSARVKAGERVKAGQPIAAIGNSGATPVPHLHYELRAAPGFGVRGVRSLPPYFHGVKVLGTGEGPGPVQLNTGDVLIAR
ncbi:MAG TPA: M23 family metallopeptidase [Caulobacteraceae bacterium]